MDQKERILKEYLELENTKIKRTIDCICEQDLIDYFMQNIEKERCSSIEKHLASCGFCRGQLNLIFESESLNKKNNQPKVPKEFIEKAKALIKSNENNVRKNRKRKKKYLFLFVAISAFVISFFLPKYFFQCLVISLVLGIRWAFESENGRTLIMVIDSWRRHSSEDDDEISKRLKNRFNSFRP